MSIARKLRRERQIQARKALRHELKDGAVQEHVKKMMDAAGMEGYAAGVGDGKRMIVESAFGLSYDG